MTATRPPGPAALADAAVAAVDRERLVELCGALVDIASPTGEEAPLARWIAGELDHLGAEGHLQPIDERQANAWGRLRTAGPGDGPTVMLYAPIDTLTTGDPAEDLPWAAERFDGHLAPRAQRDGELVSGLGAHNPKGHAACVLGAIEAIAASGVPLRGEVIAAFGAGGMPTNARDVPGPGPDGAGGQGRFGRRNTGQGVGASFLVEQGVWADAAVIAKSGWAVAWEEVGLAWLDVTVRGRHTYVGARHRLPYRNPIDDAATVISHLEAWFPTYARRHSSGLVEPQGIVAAVEAGWWRMAAVVPAAARLRVDLRLAPDQSPLDARRELVAALDELRAADPGLDLDVELAVAIPGSRTDPGHWICRTAIDAWEAVAGRPHEPITATSGATDANILRNRGIPTVRVGLPKVHVEGTELGFAEGMNTVDADAMELLCHHLVRVAVDAASRPLDELRGRSAPAGGAPTGGARP
ncbi:MAG: M20/M25/M40 family metallo-hydrolase [Actinomycetota bacterium]|nr:M20/M25/M40 family metallo-hydrolase [Actinomycetota bacterium]